MHARPDSPDSSLRAAGVCIHFGTCGGCQSQDSSYPDQLATKAEQLERVFAPFWEGPIEIAASPAVWHYRNKVDFSFAPRQYPEKPPPGFQRETVLGFNKPGKWYFPFDVEECLIAPEGADTLLPGVRAWYKTNNINAFDSRTGEGMLRILLVRDAKRTGERLVMVVTSPGEFDSESFAEVVDRYYPATSIYRGIVHRSARVAEADELELISGAPVIHEEMRVPDSSGSMRNLRFEIGPLSFFQVNLRAAEILYGYLREWVKRVAPTVLYDLYGGSGGIALACADLVPLVRSVESVPEASESGTTNARINAIDNVYFETERTKNYLQNLIESGGLEPGAAVVVDPPRSGMVPKATRRLLKLAPTRIAYVSCKPEQTAQELEILGACYEVEQIQAVDMFPHTRHVEALVLLRLRCP